MPASADSNHSEEQRSVCKQCYHSLSGAQQCRQICFTAKCIILYSNVMFDQTTMPVCQFIWTGDFVKGWTGGFACCVTEYECGGKPVRDYVLVWWDLRWQHEAKLNMKELVTLCVLEEIHGRQGPVRPHRENGHMGQVCNQCVTTDIYVLLLHRVLTGCNTSKRQLQNSWYMKLKWYFTSSFHNKGPEKVAAGWEIAWLSLITYLINVTLVLWMSLIVNTYLAVASICHSQ